MNGMHFTDEQIAELLAGEGSDGAERHLAVCDACRAEFEEMQSSLESFNAVTLEWAEQRAAQRIQPPTRARWSWPMAPVWNAVAAAGIVAATVFGIHTQKGKGHPQEVAPVEFARSETAIAEDNRLLLAIDREVNQQYNTPVLASELGMEPRRVKRPQPRMVNE